ncbi:LOW QUALITY PROTEIN: polyprotein [Phytophthora megakarya]|uniref:Polyprotein n=1 Tax=Phytophthora megakarya TaxID=4795 RepID=A0A225WJR8_9STRA|nr:LOW QUALITY PROTEIN: polyprotein [Phytophthora megakarya]
MYVNLKKCVFSAPEIPVLGATKDGVRADHEKSLIGLLLADTQELHGAASYTKDYAGLIHPLTSLLKKHATSSWRPEHHVAFNTVKKSLTAAPVLMIADGIKLFHVVCDASEFAIR